VDNLSKFVPSGVKKSAGCVVYRVNDAGVLEYLLLQHFSKWVFPKGMVNKGESIKSAALRELYEETGIHPEKISSGFKYVLKYKIWSEYKAKGKLIGFKSPRLKEVTYFLVKSNTKKVTTSSEHHGYGWGDIKTALNAIRLKEKGVLLTAHKYLSGNK